MTSVSHVYDTTYEQQAEPVAPLEKLVWHLLAEKKGGERKCAVESPNPCSIGGRMICLPDSDPSQHAWDRCMKSNRQQLAHLASSNVNRNGLARQVVHCCLARLHSAFDVIWCALF